MSPGTRIPAITGEWRQFTLLARDGVRTLLNAAMLARDGDPIQFALWTTALVATPPSLYAFGQMFKYAALRSAPAAVVERIVLGDRMFFIVYSVIAAALLAALTWDALYPDRDDHEILGALPVRPRTVTAARLAAAFGVAAVFFAAINLPAAVCFSFVAVSHPTVGVLPVVFMAQVVSTTGASLTIFALLLLLRGVASILLGSVVTDRLATMLQLVTVVALVEVFFYLPSILPVLVRGMLDGRGMAAWWPPAWFGALYSALAGPAHDVYPRQAAVGLLVMLGALAATVPMYLLPARVMARRALESQPGGRRRGWIGAAWPWAASTLARTPMSASISKFALLSLARSRRHLLVVVTFGGVGLGLALIQLIASGLRGGIATTSPTRTLLAMPLIMMFFITMGMRTAFKVPRDLQANWIFRLRTPAALDAAAGTRSAMLVAAIVPVAVLSGIAAYVAGWPIGTITAVIALDVVFGSFLLECALYGWSLVPFACARPPGQESVQTAWMAAIAPFLVFTVGGAGVQLAALRSATSAVVLAALVISATLLAGWLRRRRVRRDDVPFEPASLHLDVLNLSEALH